ncbi:CBS domain-containing protein [Picrophilus oshimae]|uniref:CBS domain-containing protein n=1 Tax=Picrophilus torridus (strain ATCC 700027 / DSM 9790 / JCM 10055 / NBRC 100828 / KAW 2/3) TaxID=1122961 RepID=A0A8G2FVV0_PICTO|nr:CBS domain-containing protein [Picrophilus oshimae]SMD30399.1 CBS domain-containing protein [Picrophilus oshimae DSM 9789]
MNKRNPLSFAFKMCMDLNARAVVVIDNNNYVLGQITLSDMISLGEGKLQTLRVYEAGIVPVIRVHCSAPATDLIRIFRDKDPPIVAVVDSNEKFVGTILEREILKYISDVLDTKN